MTGCSRGEEILHAYDVSGLAADPDKGIYLLKEIKLGDREARNEGILGLDFFESVPISADLPFSGSVRLYVQYSGIGFDSEGVKSWRWMAAYRKAAVPAPVNRIFPPRVTDLRAVQSDYCRAASGSAAILYWRWSDPAGSPQASYQIQISSRSDYENAIDSGKVDSKSAGFATHSGSLAYNTRYFWRLRAWNEKGDLSNWSYGPSFLTPLHQYPKININWMPRSPLVGEDVNFVHESLVYGGAAILKQVWTLDDAEPARSDKPDFTAVFSKKGVKRVTLSITDSDGYTCEQKFDIDVKVKVSDWDFGN
jgi:hypothetical protein